MTTEPRDPRDPHGLRDAAPLLDGWLAFGESDVASMGIPGHKNRASEFGAVIRDDVPLYAGLDLLEPYDRLGEAERRLAALWGADWARISVGGSTHGNQALALAVGRPGDEVVVSRTLHRSLLLGLVLAGLRPVWVRPDIDDVTGLPGAVPVERVRTALQRHPSACAVFLVDPSYVGTMSDVAAHAEVAHAHGVPLLVDQAWGAYLGFHPALPAHALAAGADALVTSAHKTLPAYSQAAFVLARTERLDAGRLERAFDATHTTSPSGTVLASADAARALLARDGEALLGRLLELVAQARARLGAVPGLTVLAPSPGLAVDPAKLVVLLAGTGADGLAVEAELDRAGHPVELADRDTIVPILSLADDPVTVDRFVDVLVGAVERHRGAPRPVTPSIAWTVDPVSVRPPREAFFADRERVPVADAIGRVSAELVAPYPPGIPVLAPGEQVTAALVAALRDVAASGVRVRYAADPTLHTLEVLRD